MATTSKLARETAALHSESTRAKILRCLRIRPSTLFEVATILHVPDHCIAGRFTELSRDLLIERTGERRIKPQTQCAADVWRISAAYVQPNLPFPEPEKTNARRFA
jgi:hypothetical protein